jgi:hypothetical protein
MTIDRRLIAGALGLAVGLAACGTTTSSPGGSVEGVSGTPESAAPASVAPSESAATESASAAAASGSPGASPATSPATSPAASPAASAVTSAGPATGAGASPATGATGDLAATIPDEANGITFDKRSLDGSTMSGTAFNLDLSRVNAVLEASGATMDDVRVAIATPNDASADATAIVIALRILGVDAGQVAAATGTNIESLTPSTIGGKEVFTAGSDEFLTVLYPTGDTVYQVMFADAPTAEAILAQLP